MGKFTGEVIYDEPKARTKPVVNPALVNALVPPVSSPVAPVGVTPNMNLSPQDQRAFNLAEANRKAAAKIEADKIKPLTETQSNATAFGMRMLDSNKILNALEDSGVTDTGIIRSAVSGTVGLAPFIGEKLEEKTSAAMNALPGFLGGPSAEQQQVDQARRNFITANLRKESGASIAPAEFANEEKKYFPQVGDAPAVIKQKRDARELAIRAMNIQSGNNIPNINSTNNDPLGLRPRRP